MSGGSRLMNSTIKDERKTEMKKILMILAIAMLAALPVSAQIPNLMTYQGVLTDDMGVVVSDGSYNMTFRIYDVPSGGSPLWEETFGVNVSKGIFNTILGYTTPLDLAFNEPVYLGLAIDGGAELTPRRLFTSNAHAFSALSVFGVENIFPSSGHVGIGTLTPAAPLTIRINNTDSSWPALLIENTGNQSLIDFKMATVTEARIRKAAGGDLFLGTVTGQGITFSLSNTSTHRMMPDGSFGIDNLSPVEKLDVNGAIRLGTTANTNAGTIRWTGSDFEGYDGSLWNSLTSGGGSGLPSGTSGQTLRHDGADWVANTTLTNTGTNVGIGTASPSAELHVYGTEIEETRVQSTSPTGAAAVELLTSGGSLDYLRLEKSGPSRSGTTAGSIPLANLSRITAGTQAGALMLQTVPAEPIHFVTSNLERFRITETGRFEGYYNGAMTSRLYGGTDGGCYYQYDDEGHIFYGIEPDFSTGGGGYLYLRRNNSSTGFIVDGNCGATEGTRVSVFGATSSIVLDASASGNSTVVLPTGAVSSAEILNEPGVASSTEGVYSVPILDAPTVIRARTITAPASGYVLVIATGQGEMSHTAGVSSYINFGVSDIYTSLPVNQDVAWGISSGAGSGTYSAPVTCHGLFEVSAGSNTFYFLGDKGASTGESYCYDVQLTVLYIPTSYGTVNPTMAGGVGIPDTDAPVSSISASDISSERAASIEADNARIEKELAEMRRLVEELKREVENSE